MSGWEWLLFVGILCVWAFLLWDTRDDDPPFPWF